MISQGLLSRNLSNGAQKVLIVIDASREPNTDGIVVAIRCLPLKPGDSVLLLIVMQPFSTTNTSPVIGCIAALGQKTKLHSSATIRTRKKVIQQEIQRKKDEFLGNHKIAEMRNQLEMQQIKFEIEVDADLLKEVTVGTAASFRATCVILDRHMKKDQKYFLDNLYCGILRIKHDHNVEKIRAPKMVGDAEKALKRDEAQEDILDSDSTCSLCKNIVPRTKRAVEFTYADLHLATCGFPPRSLLSNHGNPIYGGELSEGHKIAVAEHPSANISDKEFKSQVHMLSNIRHKNVATLLGWCLEGKHRFLVYQFVCNGSLNKHLSDGSRELTWERRMKIALGAAKGLQCLHSKNIHGNIKPKNILLNHDYHPLLANFGLARNQYEDLDYSSNSRVIKTLEYMAPEYEETEADVSKEDVYSFGVVLLELITGRKTMRDTNGQSYLRWARPLLRGKKYPDLIDPAIQDSHDLYQLFWMVRLAEICIRWEPERRYSIDKVVTELERIIQGSSSSREYSPTDSELMELVKRRR